MFPSKSPSEKTGLDLAIDRLLEEMSRVSTTSEEYSKMMGHLNHLYKIKDQEKPDHVKKDTMAIIAGNLAGIALITGFERANVITSKALSFVLKTR